MAINIRLKDKISMVLIVFVIVIGFLIPSDYSFNSSPEQYIKKYAGLNCKDYISTITINKEPISFFIDNRNEVGTVRFNLEDMNKKKWVFTLVNYVRTDNLIDDGVDRTWNLSYVRESTNNILFGLIPFKNGEVFKVNNQDADYFVVTINGDKFFLWYLKNANSDSIPNISFS
jgi:hypothetical protein